MKMLRILIAVLMLGAVLRVTRAALMTPLSLEELTQTANLIIHATVKDKKCERLPEGDIVTRVTVDVSEVMKGTLKTNTYVITHGGGTIGNERQAASAQVEYEIGEEVVAFLRFNHRGEGITVGLVQGKFQVWKDKVTGEKFVHNTFHGTSESEAAEPEKKEAKLELKTLSRRARGEAP